MAHIVVINPKHRNELATRFYALHAQKTNEARYIDFNYNFSVGGIQLLILIIFFIVTAILQVNLHWSNGGYWFVFFATWPITCAVTLTKMLTAHHHVIRVEGNRTWTGMEWKPPSTWTTWLVDLHGCQETLIGAADLCTGLWHEKAIESLAAVKETSWRLATLSRLPVSESIKLICKQQVKDCNDLTETILSQCVDGATGGHADIVAREVGLLISALREVDEL